MVSDENRAVLILGMGFRLPGGLDTAASLWEALAAGRDLTGPLTEDRAALMPASTQDFPSRAGYLRDPDAFDAAFFNVKGLEAHHMDPNQRLLLETAWWAIEDACLTPALLAAARTGVYVGVHAFDYSELCSRSGQEVNAYWNLGLNGAVTANRLSWFFDLTGPSEMVNTACSSGLTALDHAVTALETGRCDYALVGGVNLILTPTISISAARAGMLSPGGLCKTFDADADGFVRGEGACCLLLGVGCEDGPPHAAAYARIAASRTGHGGHANSLTTPHLGRMRDLLIQTYARAGVTFEQVGYLETHGTGTRLGDAVEADALVEASTAMGAVHGDCQLGSIKTNFGHLEAAAGLAGVIKVCLALQRGLRPGLVHYQTANPMIDFAGVPFALSAQTTPWPAGGPRIAGVSSFGFGGSLAHVVLTRASAGAQALSAVDMPRVLPVSARNEDALRELVAAVLDLARTERPDVLALATAFQWGRPALAERLALVFVDLDDLISGLAAFLVDGADGVRSYQGRVPVRKRRKVSVSTAELTQPAELAAFWAAGGTVAWPDLVADRPGGLMRIPPYPFRRRRYWITRLEGDQA